jgi:Beta-propeller repeat
VVNPYQGFAKSYTSLFVTKFAADGRSLIYSTYLGGSGDKEGDSERGSRIAVDVSGSAYITGTTSSADFPTKQAFQPSLNGRYDIFVTKFAIDGKSLIYSTYLGGKAYNLLGDIAVDALGRAYVIGTTNSKDFPVKDAFQSSSKAIEDVFITIFAADGRSLIYSTYLSGRDNSHRGTGIAVDTVGSVYVTGDTAAEDFPTKDPFQAPYFTLGTHAFVTKLSPFSDVTSFREGAPRVSKYTVK